MKDLYRCLDDYSPELLQAIGQAWGFGLPKGEQREIVMRLAEAMLSPHAANDLLKRLSADAQAALAQLVNDGGMLPGHRLSLNYGGIRRFGPARMAREQPWLQPQGTLEELFYSGIIYRAYGAIDEYTGEIVFVPSQLLERLPPLGQGSRLEPERAGEPKRVAIDGRALVEDLFIGLVGIRRTQLPSDGLPTNAIGPHLRQALLVSRWSGEDRPERLALVWRLLWRLGLIRQDSGILQPSDRAREWLRLPDTRRLHSIYLGWRDDPQQDELRLLPTLRPEETGWHNNPVAARHQLLAALGRLPRSTWFSLDSFVQVLKRRRPDYLRPDGDFDSWYIRDAQTNEYLSGYASWDRIEGELARYMISGPLRWLGITNVGYGEESDQPLAFSITDKGAELLTEDEGMLGDKTPSRRQLVAAVSTDLLITISTENSLYERYHLERFSEWQPSAEDAVYQITADSVWRSQDAGIKTEQILRFLKRISRNRVPESVMRTLRAWGGRFGRAAIRGAVLLQTIDEATMEQISAQPATRDLLSTSLSPTVCLVEETNVAELIERLKALGIWPQVRL